MKIFIAPELLLTKLPAAYVKKEKKNIKDQIILKIIHSGTNYKGERLCHKTNFLRIYIEVDFNLSIKKYVI